MTKAQSLGCLEEGFSDGPKISPPLDISKGNGVTKQIVFRELAETTKQRLRFDAIGWVEALRVKAEAAFGGTEWRDVSWNLEEMRGNRWDTLLLHAATRDAEHPEREAAPLRWYEMKMGTPLHQHIAAKHADFENGLNPDFVDPEVLSLVIEDIKKNDPSIAELWTRYGTLTLLACLLFSVSQLEMSDPETSSDTSLSGE